MVSYLWDISVVPWHSQVSSLLCLGSGTALHSASVGLSSCGNLSCAVVHSQATAMASEDGKSWFERQKIFVALLKEVPVLLAKSQVPSVKVKKAEAADFIIAEYKKQVSVALTKNQLQKKINNMRNTIKTKGDVKKTGNRPVHLNDWKKDLMDLMDTEGNPSFSCVPGKGIIHWISSIAFTKTQPSTRHFISARTLITTFF